MYEHFEFIWSFFFKHPLTYVSSPSEALPNMRHPDRVSAAGICNGCTAARERAEGPFGPSAAFAASSAFLLDEPSKLIVFSLMYRMGLSSEWLYVYILANSIGVLYIGVTNNLVRRIDQHRAKLNKGFTSKKHCFRLVYFELHTSPGEAIAREKQIKGWRREKKEFLIRTLNPPGWI